MSNTKEVLIDGAEKFHAAFDRACGAFYCEHQRLPTPIEIFAIAQQRIAELEKDAQAVRIAALEEAVDRITDVDAPCDASAAAIEKAADAVRALKINDR